MQIPPNELASERYICGAAILSAADRKHAIRLVNPTHFYNDLHGAILHVIRRLDGEHALDVSDDESTAAIIAAIDESGIGRQISGGLPAFLQELMESVITTGMTVYHAGKVVRAASQRRLISELEAASGAVWQGESLDEICQRLRKSADTVSSEWPRKPSFSTMTAADLDAAHCELTYLVDNVLVSGQPCIMAATKKSLKTTIAIDLVLSLSSGSPFLGEFPVPCPVRVALMSGESGDATIQETARRIAWAKPWKNLSDYHNAVFSFDLPRLGQPETKRELTGFIRDNGLQVLIIDPAYLCLDLGDDAGNLFSVGKKLRELTEIGHATGCTVILIHHCRKSGVGQEQFAAPELESIAWSGFQEWARQWILLGRREAYNPEAAGTHKLWLSCGGSAGHCGLWGVDIEEGSRTDPTGQCWSVSVTPMVQRQLFDQGGK